MTQNVILNVLVNEVLESEKLQVTRYEVNKTHQFARYHNGTTETNSREAYEKDSNGRKIKTSPATACDQSNHYVCNEKFVIPRYVIEFYGKVSLRF